MSNNNGGQALAKGAQGLLYQRLAGCVQRAGGLVQQQHANAVPPNERTSNGDALTLQT